MDFNLKQGRFHHQQKQDESDLEQQQQHQQQLQQQTPSGPNSALPLFVSEITNNNNNNNNNKSVSLSLPTISSSSSSICKMGSTSSCYFSLTQWQELELQALIYKHMLAGAAVPPQLLHLLNKTLLRSSLPSTLTPTPTYALHPFHHYSHYQSPLLQSGVGYWGRPGGSMDPEPGRCRRTDGKKWRCSRDVVPAHKYCDRHMHRGRNRSRKPVESSSSSISTTNTTTAANSLIHSGTTTTSHLNHRKRTLDVVGTENKGMFGMQNEVAMSREMKPDRVLRHFFDDWPRPLDHEAENAEVHNNAPANLSISTNASSDFSLKLATGHEEEEDNTNNAERDLNQLNWASGWRGAGPMGGPLAEALRSSMAATTTDSSPTSVLHHLARNPKSDDTSYVSNC